MTGIPISTTEPIRAGDVSKSPTVWAAQLAGKAPGELVEFKNAILWLEGQSFGSEEDLRDAVARVIAFQQDDARKPTAHVAVAADTTEDEWEAAPAKKTKKVKQPRPTWSAQDLGSAIVDAAIRKLQIPSNFKFAGPSLRISDVYEDFAAKKGSFTYPALIGAVRAAIGQRGNPSALFPVKNSARYWAESSPGKGSNFNFKVQVPDKDKPNGWSAAAQIHVLWE
jgi:hypothetical protein